MTRRILFALLFTLPVLMSRGLVAQVTYQRLLDAAKEPQNWLTYSGGYFGQRHSGLRQLDATNAQNLELKWVYQGAVIGNWQATPLVVDGVMYVSQRPNDVVALDARTGRAFWMYRHNTPADHRACCGANNRGLAVSGDTLYMGTLDARLVAIDTKSGRQRWSATVADMKAGYSVTLAPLVVKDKVIIGVGGGDLGIRGYIAAYNAETGKEVWRFYTIPGPGEPGHETWEKCPPASKTYCDDNAWMHGGASVWVTGTYDPALNMTYWGIGNAGPDYNPAQRPGDNLYAASVVALDADSGRLRWHYQFTPSDPYDYDSVQIPVLADITWNGGLVKAMLFANRNGFFYVLDRATGRFLMGKPFVKVNWASGFDERGRPIQTPQPPGSPTYPGNQGGTNWYSPSYSPRTGLLYLSAWEGFATIFQGVASPFQEGRYFVGGNSRNYAPVPDAPAMPTLRRGPINNWTDAVAHGAVIALDPSTGERKWTFPMTDISDSGVLTTASDLLFTGGREGYFQALDARTGKLLWRTNLGGQIVSGPMTYEVEGKQYVTTISGNNLVAFALRD